jgi:hypothetical protein
VRAFIGRFSVVMIEAGFPPMPARVFLGLLTAPAEGRTAAELQRLLMVSAAAVSLATRYLLQIKLIARERATGERVDRYVMHDDQWFETLGQRDEVLKRWEAGLAEGARVCGESTVAGRRLEDSRRFFEFSRIEMKGIRERWRKERERQRAQRKEPR